MRLHSLIDALQKALRQELSLLCALSPEQYRLPAAGHFCSSVGMHLRHNLDHFEAFFDGLKTGEIDYESRSREGQIEDVPSLAEGALNDFIAKLETLRALAETPLQIREESEAGTKERHWLDSSLGRELQFLLGHTVHHNAIIAMIVDRHGLKLPQGFGVAPSTQRHQAKAEPVAY
jgi:uncharacterized damage-inducible protein DinB